MDGLITTLAWDLGTEGDVALGADGGPSMGRSSVAYALEGSVFVSGAGVQWLRDGLGIIDDAAEMEPLARSVESSEASWWSRPSPGSGAHIWDPAARGTILGLSRGTGRAHLARAMVEAMSFQVRDVLDAMAATGDRAVGAPGRRRGLGHGPPPAAAGRPVPSACGPTPLGGDDRHRGGHPGRPGRGGVGLARRAGRAVDRGRCLRPAGVPAEAEAAHQAWVRAVDRSRHWSQPLGLVPVAAGWR